MLALEPGNKLLVEVGIFVKRRRCSGQIAEIELEPRLSFVDLRADRERADDVWHEDACDAVFDRRLDSLRDE